MEEHYCQRIPDPDPRTLRIGAKDDPNVCGKLARFSCRGSDFFCKETWERWSGGGDDKTYYLCAECFDFVTIWSQLQY